MPGGKCSKESGAKRGGGAWVGVGEVVADMAIQLALLGKGRDGGHGHTEPSFQQVSPTIGKGKDTLGVPIVSKGCSLLSYHVM